MPKRKKPRPSDRPKLRLEEITARTVCYTEPELNAAEERAAAKLERAKKSGAIPIED